MMRGHSDITCIHPASWPLLASK